MSNNNIQEFSTDLLRLYYDRLFPAEHMFKWLSYGNDASAPPNSPFSDVMDKQFFNQREWSFTIEDDIYIRYQNFKDKDEMLAAIKKRQPHKIDIGAVFSAPPKEHTTIKQERFYPVERELVFDIDMTDYDPIRTCCSGANICLKCWPFMTMAIKCVDKALRDDFAYKHILWIYSGRRGVHCWVNDKEARELTNEARSAVVEYLSLEVEGKDEKLLRQVEAPLHPHLMRSYDILEPYFENAICDNHGQGLFATKKLYVPILNTIPDEMEALRKEIFESMEDSSLSGAERWRLLKAAITPSGGQQLGAKKRGRIDYKKLDQWRHHLVFKYTYPRLDANVSKSMNHLLKSPFCVHPKTGRVCIPMDPAEADQFDPFTVPTVRTLCEEINAFDRENPDNTSSDTEKTAMRSAIEVFERTFMGPMWKDITAEFRDKAGQRDAMIVDF